MYVCQFELVFTSFQTKYIELNKRRTDRQLSCDQLITKKGKRKESEITNSSAGTTCT